MKCIVCSGADHELCLSTVRRCATCTLMIFNQTSHECTNDGNDGLPKNFRISPFATIPGMKCGFQMRTRNDFEVNGAELHYFNVENGRFEEFFNSTIVLSPTTSGIFTMNTCTTYNTVKYEATKETNFVFYIALLDFEGAQVSLRAIVTRHGIFLQKFDGIISGNGIEEKFKMNTVFILGLKVRSDNIKLRILHNSKCQTAKWERVSGWHFHEPISDYALPVENHAGICRNCNKHHDMMICDLPWFTSHCTGCLVISVDGYGHENPCMVKNKISSIRPDVLARNTLTLFRLSFSMNDAKMVYMNNDSTFSELDRQVKLLSGPAESILTVEDEDNEQSIALKQVSFKRCCILLGYLDQANQYRLRFRLVLSPQHGLLVFKLHRTLNFVNGRAIIPREHVNNTIAVFILQPKVQSIYIKLSVYANKDGKLSNQRFDGYNAFLGLDLAGNRDHIHVDAEVDGTNLELEKKRFNEALYKPEPIPISTFKEQRVAPAVSR